MTRSCCFRNLYINILATGLSGLVGTRIKELLQDKYSFTDLSFSTGVDITDEKKVSEAFSKSDAQWVLHLAALADVDKCETEKELAYKINVLGTRNIAQACKKFNKKIIHISTDFVFSGDESSEYFEDSKRKSCNYYAETKILAEDEVMKTLDKKNWIILRIAHPYKKLVEDEPKKSFFQRMYEVLKNDQELKAIEDFYSHPTFIDDIANSIDKLIKLNFSGIYHCVGDSFLSGAEEAEIICEVFNFDKSLIKKIKLNKFFEGRAKRPHQLNLNNDKIKKATGIKLHSFREGLLQIREQMKKINF